MKDSFSKNLLLTASAFSLYLGGGVSPTFAAEGKGLEEVIVTAQRREENSQDVAISVTVFNQEQVANANMINSNDIATYTPSLSTNTRFGSENTSFSIRGFTQALRTAASVGTYFAEVVAPRGQTSQTSGDGAGPGTLFDLANIQVLKGPQGTLFGRNTTGGAILLTPQKPTDTFEGYAEVSTGDFGAQRQQLVVSGALRDNVQARFGIDNNKRDGHLENFAKVGADELGNTDYTAFRLGFNIDISSSIENYTLLTYVDSESNGYTSQMYACNDATALEGNLFGAFVQASCENQLEAQAAAGKDGFYDVVSTIPTALTSIEEERFINTTTWTMSENITLKGILAYAHLETYNTSDIFGTYFPETLPVLGVGGGLLALLNGGTEREFTTGISVLNPDVPVTSSDNYVAELQLQGLSLDGAFVWQAGLYYENSTPDGFSGNNSAAFLNCDLSTVEGDPSQYDCTDITAGTLGSILVQNYKTEFLNQAVYFQGTYDIVEQLSVTLGLRYTMDETEGYGIKKRYTFAPVGGSFINEIITTSSPKVSSEVPTGMLEFNYRPFSDVMLYAKYTRGYRQGSVNLAADPGLDEHQYETVDTFEIGAKTEFGGPIPGRFNIAFFDNSLTDMQLQAGYISATAGPTTAITNAGEAQIRGFEMESTLLLSENLRFNFSYSYLDTELLEQGQINTQLIADSVTAAALSGGADPVTATLQGQIAAQTYTPIALVGDELPFAAESSWVASLNYDLPLPAEIGIVTLGATYVYTGEMRASATGTSVGNNDVLDDFSLINLNASWIGILGSNFDLSLYATNTTDEEYTTYTSGTYFTLGFESRQVGMPRMVGGRLRYSF
jgi:iron complex outermembrane recepter protein